MFIRNSTLKNVPALLESQRESFYDDSYYLLHEASFIILVTFWPKYAEDIWYICDAY